jgi:uncharacterized protein (TIGR03435 family)
MRRVASWLIVPVLVVFAVGTASAQQAPPKKSFEVASIKVAPPLDPQKMLSGQQRVGMKVDAGRVDIENWSTLELLNAAFKIPLTRLTGPAAPTMAGVLTATRFEIHATFPPGATKDDVPEMLQSLLAERFKLQYHSEKREQNIYALVVGKDGAKLEKSPEDAPPSGDTPANNTNRPDAISVSGDPQKGMTIRGAGNAGAMKMNMTPDGLIHLEAEKLTMEQLADSVTQYVGRPVIDETGLKGNYRITIEMTQADVMAMARQVGLQVPSAPGADASDPGGGSSMFRSVEKMGLKLESRKAPVDYFVIDRLEKTPTED